MAHYVYVLESVSNGKRYVGSTGQVLCERVKQHNRGATSWARRNGPFRLLYWEEHPRKTEALKRERFLKTGVGRRIRDELVRASGVRAEVSSAGGRSASGGDSNPLSPTTLEEQGTANNSKGEDRDE